MNVDINKIVNGLLEEFMHDIANEKYEEAKKILNLLEVLPEIIDEQDAKNRKSHPFTCTHKYEVGELIRIIDSMETVEYIVDVLFKGNLKDAMEFIDDLTCDSKTEGFEILRLSTAFDANGNGIPHYQVKSKTGNLVYLPENIVEFVF